MRRAPTRATIGGSHARLPRPAPRIRLVLLLWGLVIGGARALPLAGLSSSGVQARGGPVMSLTVFSVAVLFTSLGAGVVGAILGLGGGILLVPILTIFYGVDLHYAMGASIIS